MKWIADEAIKNYRQVSGYIPGRGVFFRDNAYARLMRADGGFGDGIGDDANGSIPADDGIRGGVGDEVLRVIFLIFIQHEVSQMGTVAGVPGVIL